MTSVHNASCCCRCLQVTEEIATVCAMVSIGSAVFYRPKDKQASHTPAASAAALLPRRRWFPGREGEGGGGALPAAPATIMTAGHCACGAGPR